MAAQGFGLRRNSCGIPEVVQRGLPPRRERYFEDADPQGVSSHGRGRTTVAGGNGEGNVDWKAGHQGRVDHRCAFRTDVKLDKFNMLRACIGWKISA